MWLLIATALCKLFKIFMKKFNIKLAHECPSYNLNVSKILYGTQVIPFKN